MLEDNCNLYMSMLEVHIQRANLHLQLNTQTTYPQDTMRNAITNGNSCLSKIICKLPETLSVLSHDFPRGFRSQLLIPYLCNTIIGHVERMALHFVFGSWSKHLFSAAASGKTFNNQSFRGCCSVALCSCFQPSYSDDYFITQLPPMVSHPFCSSLSLSF